MSVGLCYEYNTLFGTPYSKSHMKSFGFVAKFLSQDIEKQEILNETLTFCIPETMYLQTQLHPSKVIFASHYTRQPVYLWKEQYKMKQNFPFN